jgi:hypothetical protein
MRWERSSDCVVSVRQGWIGFELASAIEKPTTELDCVVSVRQCWIGFGTGFGSVEKPTTELDWLLPRGHPVAIDQEEKDRGAL